MNYTSIILSQFCVLLTLLASISLGDERVDTDPLVNMRKLSEAWKAHRELSVSIVASGYRGYCILPPRETLSIDSICSGFLEGAIAKLAEKLKDNLDTSTLEAETIAYFDPSFVSKDGSRTKGEWRQFSFHTDNSSVFYKSFHSSFTTTTVRRNGREQHYSTGTGQAHVYTTFSPLLLPSFDTFSPPGEAWTPKSFDSVFSTLEGKQCTFSYNTVNGRRVRISSRSDTFFPFLWEELSNKGNTFRARFCGGFRKTSEGFTAPTVIAELSYISQSKGSAPLPCGMHIWVLNDISFLKTLDASAFMLPVPKGTTVIKAGVFGSRPENGARFPTVLLREDIQDAEIFTTTLGAR